MLNDYPELITEVAERSGVSDVVTRAKMYVGMAEKALSKRLRLSGQETDVELTTDATGSVDLPVDYQEMRSILRNTYPVVRRPLGLVLKGGTTGYAIKGKKLWSTYKSTAHDCVYYAAIPSLEVNNTNWLLDDDPELYLHAVLFQVYTAKNEFEKAQATAGYLLALIDAANCASHMQRHAGTRISVPGVAV